MKISTQEIATATDGRASGPAVVVNGMAYDSRNIEGGELFVPLHGARDGHEWIDAALAAGAAAYLTELEPGDGSAVRVENTLDALGAIASVARSRIDRVVAVTGSVGKTTTKDLMLAVLGRRFRAHASYRSYNNAVGVPHTIIGAHDDTEVLVVELGANAGGEIRDLCAIARPDVGVVTRVASAHTEGFGSIDDVARAKRELVEALPASGFAVLNSDDPRVAAMAHATKADVLFVGSAGDVRAAVVNLDEGLRPLIRFLTPWGNLEVRLTARGAHQVTNAAAAVAVGALHGVPMDDIGLALEGAKLSDNRMDLQVGRDGVLVLDDSYNANPTSVEAALRALVEVPGRRHFAALGIMAELGAIDVSEHRRIGKLATDLGVNVISVDAPAYGVKNVPDVEHAIREFADLGMNDVVLVKGSRIAQLDRLAAILRRT